MQGFLSKTHAFYNTHTFYATLLHSGALTEEMPGRISFAPLKKRTKRAHLYSRLQPADVILESYRHGNRRMQIRRSCQSRKKAEEVFDVRKKDNYEP